MIAGLGLAFDDGRLGLLSIFRDARSEGIEVGFDLADDRGERFNSHVGICSHSFFEG